MTLTCQCGQPYQLSASGIWRHRYVYSHTPSLGGKSERKEG